jgi:hypothetical protein
MMHNMDFSQKVLLTGKGRGLEAPPQARRRPCAWFRVSFDHRVEYALAMTYPMLWMSA